MLLVAKHGGGSLNLSNPSVDGFTRLGWKSDPVCSQRNLLGYPAWPKPSRFTPPTGGLPSQKTPNPSRNREPFVRSGISRKSNESSRTSNEVLPDEPSWPRNQQLPWGRRLAGGQAARRTNPEPQRLTWLLSLILCECVGKGHPHRPIVLPSHHTLK